MPSTAATIVSVETLAERLGDPQWTIVDCRFDLADPTAGRHAYAAAHIPGAVYAHLDDDLAGPVTAATGRHPLPEPGALARRLGAWGVDETRRLVAYDDASAAIAARLWWLARWLGHARVAVLDGGFAAWCRAGLPVEQKLPRPPARRFALRQSLVDTASTADLVANLTGGDLYVVDARAAARFAGTAEPIDRVAGHIPGAINHPFGDNLDAQQQFLPVGELRRRWQAHLDAAHGRPIVSYCGSGVTACHNLLALELAGLPAGRLYPGSWSEWIRDARRPVATSD